MGDAPTTPTGSRRRKLVPVDAYSPAAAAVSERAAPAKNLRLSTLNGMSPSRACLIVFPGSRPRSRRDGPRSRRGGPRASGGRRRAPRRRAAHCLCRTPPAPRRSPPPRPRPAFGTDPIVVPFAGFTTGYVSRSPPRPTGLPRSSRAARHRVRPLWSPSENAPGRYLVSPADTIGDGLYGLEAICNSLA